MTQILTVAAILIFLWVLGNFVASLARALGQVGQPLSFRVDERDLLELVAEKREALSALKESELDYETDKVGDREYEQVHAAASEEAFEVMRRLDEIRARMRYQQRIERDLESFDASVEAVSGESEGDWLVDPGEWEARPALSEAARVRARRHAEGTGPGAVTAFCAACGQALVQGARFCSGCGKRVGESVRGAP